MPGGLWEGSSKLWKFMGRAWGQPFSLSLLRFPMRHGYGPIPKILGFAPGALISNLGEDRGRLFLGGGGGCLIEGGLLNFSQIVAWYDHFF